MNQSRLLVVVALLGAAFVSVTALAAVPEANECISPAPLKMLLEPAETHVDYGSFFPIGWSESGDFAYAQAAAFDGENDEMTVEILSPAVEPPAWSLLIGGSSEPGEREVQALENLDCAEAPARHQLEMAWRPNAQRINSRLESYGIVRPERGWTLLAGDRLTWFKGDDLSLDAKVTSVENEGFPGVACVLDYRLLMHSGDRGAKVVYEAEYDQETCPIAINVKGALKSPYENRIVLILEQNSLGFEGTKNDYVIVGAHLEMGFR